MWLLSLMGRLPKCTLFESTWSPAQPYLVATRVSLISSPRPGSACSAHSGVLVTIGSSTHAPRHTPVAGPPPDIFMSHFFIFLRPLHGAPFPGRHLRPPHPKSSPLPRLWYSASPVPAAFFSRCLVLRYTLYFFYWLPVSAMLEHFLWGQRFLSLFFIVLSLLPRTVPTSSGRICRMYQWIKESVFWDKSGIFKGNIPRGSWKWGTKYQERCLKCRFGSHPHG